MNPTEEFVDLDMARRKASIAARTIVANEIAAGVNQIAIELHIHDEAGARLAALPFSAAMVGFD